MSITNYPQLLEKLIKNVRPSPLPNIQVNNAKSKQKQPK